MSNPPFGSPLYHEEDDFSFPIHPPNYEPIINYPPLVIEDQNSLPSTSSLLPMPEFEDLSMFFDDNIEQDYTQPIGQHHHDSNIHHTINWANPIMEQQAAVGLDDQVAVHHQQEVAIEGSSLGLHDEMQYYGPTTMATMMMTTTTIDDQGPAPGGSGAGEGSSSKKLDHNAKEKVRRMKINETFYTLRSLLPDSKRAKISMLILAINLQKRWSAPYIIDRALDYIPQLQAEVEKLTLEKTTMLSVIGSNKQQVVLDHGVENRDTNKTLTVSINEVKSGEVIIQICEQNNKAGILSTLIQKLEEEEGFHILGASSQRACEDRSCFHLHVQMGDNNPVEADYVAVLHKKIIFWLS